MTSFRGVSATAVFVVVLGCGPGDKATEPASGTSGDEDETSTTSASTTTSTATTDDPSATTLASSSSSTTEPGSTSAEESSSSSTGADGCDIGGSNRCTTPGYDGPGECDPYQQDCAAGEKCLPYSPEATGVWDTTRCAPIVEAPAQVGEACTMTAGSATGGEDTCDIGLVCWDLVGNNGTCAALCGCGVGSPTCEASSDLCAVFNGGAVAVCRPTCIPTDPETCGPDQVCEFVPTTDVWQCLNALDDMGPGEPCDSSSECAPGHVCGNSQSCTSGSPCCLAYCDVGDAASCDSECTPIFPNGAPYECYDAIGICGLE